jgi:SAM-dependent methyltransferase
MTDQFASDPPSPFVIEWAHASRSAADRLPPGRALDLAAGRGRHALGLAELGWRVIAVDADLDALRTAQARAAARGLRLRAWCADLTQTPLPRAAFELVVVTRYLQRSLFESIRHAVVPGGVVVYETFTVHQRALGVGPTSPDHLLDAGELLQRFEGFELMFYEEVIAPQALARLVARRR